MVRVRSRKNNSYFVSSPLTCLTVSGLLAGWAGGQQERRWGRGVLQGGGGEVVEEAGKINNDRSAVLQGLVVRRLGSAIQRINPYPVDKF